MNVATRLPLALSFLIGVFVAMTGVAAVVLASVRDPVLGMVAGIAAVACLAAAVIAWLAIGSVQEDTPEPRDLGPVAPRRPVRVQPLPPAELPPAYLDAVRKGDAANRAAFQARSAHH